MTAEQVKTGWRLINPPTPHLGGKGIGKMVGVKKGKGNKILNMEISVLFFGVLAEVAGTHLKHYRSINSFGDLKHRVEDDFPDIVHYNFRIAVNNKIVNEEPLLSHGDEIAYLPPFAGG